MAATVGTRPGTIIRFGRFALDCADERLLGPDGPIRLGNKAYQVLCRLIEQDGALLTKEALFSSVWDGTIVSESALTSVVKELRRALGDDPKSPRFIESVYGRGYRFVGQAATDGEAVAAPAPPPAGRDRPPVILVSAFEDDAVRARHPHLGPSLREEVLSGLARFREIHLVADGRSETLAEADRRHAGGRAYHLTAALLPDGDGLKVIARAKTVGEGRVLWADTLRLDDTGRAGGVEHIVRRIIGSALPAVDEDILRSLPHETDAFYDRYLIAKSRSLEARTYPHARAAAAALEALVGERPDFGLAYPPLVRLYNVDYGWTGLGATGRSERSRALALARQGLAVDRGNVHAHTVLGFCQLWHGERDLARVCLERALELNPYNAMRLNEVATGFAWLGEHDRAAALFDYSLALQPAPDEAYYEDRIQLASFQGDDAGVLALVRQAGAPRLWSSLYEALARFALGEPAALPQLAAWRARVERCWHDGARPVRAELDRWILFHHPLPDGDRRFFADRVARALDAAELKAPAAELRNPLPSP